MTLPHNIHRCNGSGEPGAWREGCDDCQRRTDRDIGPDTPKIAPPTIVVLGCEFRMPPVEAKAA